MYLHHLATQIFNHIAHPPHARAVHGEDQCCYRVGVQAGVCHVSQAGLRPQCHLFGGKADAQCPACGRGFDIGIIDLSTWGTHRSNLFRSVFALFVGDFSAPPS